MKRMFLTAVWLLLATVTAASLGRADVTVSVDPAAPWLGYMNVFELPANGGGFVFGQPWGTADLVAVFTGPTLRLSPNVIGDPNVFWYQDPTMSGNQNPGGPGAPGNKIMDANFYVEFPAGEQAGVTVTFNGNVTANTLTSAHVAKAFIRDFAPDYSSFNTTEVVLTPGAFSIALPTDPGAGRHVQYGFNFNGPNVWVTDVAPFGFVTVTATSAAAPGDFNNDSHVNGSDFIVWQQNPAVGNLSDWKANYGNPPAVAAVSSVPEPTGLAAIIVLSSLLAARKLRERA